MPARLSLERAAAKLGGPVWARQFFRRVEQAALLAALNISQEAYAEELIRKGTGCWAVAPEGDKEVLIDRATSRAMDHPNRKPIERGRASALSPDVDPKTFLYEHLAGVENFPATYIGYIHKDKKGNMTVGFGHWLPDVEEALRLRKYFMLKKIGEPASDKQIRKDFEVVTAEGKKDVDQRSDADLTKTEIRKEEAEKLAINDIETKLKETRAEDEFGAFDTYTFEAKLAVLDMAYNKGARGTADYKKGTFSAAIKARNWKRAAELSSRGTDVQPERNAQIREWLLKAAEKEPCWVEGKEHTQLKPVIVWGRGANPALTVDAGPIRL